MDKLWILGTTKECSKVGRKVRPSSIISYGLEYLRSGYSRKAAKTMFPRHIAKDNSSGVTVSLSRQLWEWVDGEVLTLQKAGVKGVTRSSFIAYSIAFLRFGFKRADLYKIPCRAVLKKKQRQFLAAGTDKHAKRNTVAASCDAPLERRSAVQSAGDSAARKPLSPALPGRPRSA